MCHTHGNMQEFICRSTEAHYTPAMPADKTKEETATKKLEIMTSNFTSRTAITQSVHSLAPLWGRQIYLLERCFYCDLTFRERGGTAPAFPCLISLTLIPHYWGISTHITTAAGSTGASHGWEVEGTACKQGAFKTAAGLLQHHPHIQHLGVGFTCFMEENFTRA